MRLVKWVQPSMTVLRGGRCAFRGDTMISVVDAVIILLLVVVLARVFGWI